MGGLSGLGFRLKWVGLGNRAELHMGYSEADSPNPAQFAPWTCACTNNESERERERERGEGKYNPSTCGVVGQL